MGPGVQMEHLSQTLEEQHPESSVLELARGANRHLAEEWVRTILGCLLFSREDVYKPVGVLSTGERIRLGFVSLILSQANPILLEEPFSYLDLFVREAVEEALLAFPGTTIMITHDRFFVD